MSSRLAARQRGRSPPVQLTAQQLFALAVGRTIRVLRVRRQLSQETLGQLADLHRNFVGHVERAEGNPTLSTIVALVVALDFAIGEVGAVFTTCLREIRRDAAAGRAERLGAVLA